MQTTITTTKYEAITVAFKCLLFRIFKIGIKDSSAEVMGLAGLQLYGYRRHEAYLHIDKCRYVEEAEKDDGLNKCVSSISGGIELDNKKLGELRNKEHAAPVLNMVEQVQEIHLIEPSPSYGRGRDGLGGWFSSLIGGSHLTDVVISGTDISKITRKPSRTGKHGHEKRKSSIEAKDAKPKPEKVNLQSNWSNFGQQEVTP
ncbi:hypothetical protein Tco_0115336 [Tanacetum coccineum]